MRVSVFLSLVGVFASRVALAQTPADEARRGRLLDEATTAVHAGDHARAVQLAEEAATIRVTPSHHLLLAEEHETLSRDAGQHGHLLNALDHARRCAEGARQNLSLRDRARVLARCDALVSGLVARTARLRLALPLPVPEGLVVDIDQLPVERARWGEPYETLPGVVEVDVAAPGYVPFQQNVTLAAGAEVTLEVTLTPTPRPAPPPEPVPNTLIQTSPYEPPPVPQSETAPRRSVAGPVALLVSGVAVASSAAIFYVLQRNAQSEREGLCPADASGRNACPTVNELVQSDTIREREETLNAFVWISLGVGAVAAVGGMTWLGVSRAASASPRWSITPTARGAALSVGGTF